MYYHASSSLRGVREGRFIVGYRSFWQQFPLTLSKGQKAYSPQHSPHKAQTLPMSRSTLANYILPAFRSAIPLSKPPWMDVLGRNTGSGSGGGGQVGTRMHCDDLGAVSLASKITNFGCYPRLASIHLIGTRHVLPTMLEKSLRTR